MYFFFAILSKFSVTCVYLVIWGELIYCYAHDKCITSWFTQHSILSAWLLVLELLLNVSLFCKGFTYTSSKSCLDFNGMYSSFTDHSAIRPGLWGGSLAWCWW
jgi:hypothetical protein